ncbi:membrane-associated proteins in eicosanoid and glutathione metabolism [Acaromyces ingoldii]|uniref:Glutathione S-transferase 3, mitochondrial n=1 Tax=Acaromyces ingoldii TaxID=215250 RepID=A0A316YMG9_9BASI|nr:membrane-associated proteins in eicosanoid and glutathione metabolism [Acaromyces ingoldii]PWN90352.1 membrane-associated proteins in eicosanoid and glutathione metabolism [Acaromyces ingoldii]
MPFTMVLPTAYPYVLAAASGISILNIFQFLNVSKARRAAKIEYPHVYASKEQCAASKDALVFNCAQRAHANTLELTPTFLVSTLLAGLSAPRVATVLAATWLVSRVFYTLGYTTGNPKKRTPGALLGFVGLVGLIGTSLYSVFGLLAANDFAF